MAITIDSTAPTTLAAPTVAGAPTTNDNTPDISGTCVSGDIITAQVNGTNIAPTALCAAGTYTITPSVALADGTYNVTVTATDTAGNLSGVSPVSSITVTTLNNTTSGTGTSSAKKSRINYPGRDTYYVCKDSRALNFSNKGIHKESICQYSNNTEKEEQLNQENSWKKDNKCSSLKIVNENMKKGDRDGWYSKWQKGIISEVKILQEYMNRLGFKSGPIDGIFGPITNGAVKRMQKFLGTYQDGRVGSITRSLINNSC